MTYILPCLFWMYLDTNTVSEDRFPEPSTSTSYPLPTSTLQHH
jgi:hypothetical protein